MEVQVLGAGNEVGRSAIFVRDKTKILLDCGVKVQPEPPTYPQVPQGIDACIISHAHLDHCGGLPALFSRPLPKAYMTDLTLELATLLVNDSMKVAKKKGFLTPFRRHGI